ncbi:hypothetical protein NMG60_11004837 [Bertholletia excelsa]
MAFSNWICTSSPKNQFVKIVHPGGHIELDDKPVLAAEIILRNPKCCLAHPHVFKQPWAIVAPDTTLMPGQKFYVVPMGTIRKLQKLSLKQSPSFVPQGQAQCGGQYCEDGEEVGDNTDERVFTCCIRCFIPVKSQGRGEKLTEEARPLGSSGASEMVGLRRGQTSEATRKSPRRRSLDYWKPRLESVCEE